MTLPASRYYTAADLTWFSLDRYAQLAEFSFAQWHDLVRDRLHAQHVLKAVLDQSSELLPLWLQEHWGLTKEQITDGDSEVLNDLASHIKDCPLDNLDAQMTFTGTERPAATSTIRLITGSYLQDLHGRARKANILGSTMEVDGALINQRPEPKSTQLQPTLAHVVVNMDATDKQLAEDFKIWLAEWRSVVDGRLKNESYSKARKEWCDRRIVPYFDLKLLGKIERKVIREEDLVELLGLGDNETKQKKAFRNLARWQSDLFCEETMTMLAHLSYSDARSQFQKNLA